MEVVDSMCGKWKIDNAATDNFDGYAAAMKFTDEMKEKIKSEKNITNELKRTGDTIELISTYSYGGDTLTFKLGETFTATCMGVEVENLFSVEGDVLVGKHTFMGQTTGTRRFLRGGRVVLESEGNGVHMTQYMDKC